MPTWQCTWTINDQLNKIKGGKRFFVPTKIFIPLLEVSFSHSLYYLHLLISSIPNFLVIYFCVMP